MFVNIISFNDKFLKIELQFILMRHFLKKQTERLNLYLRDEPNIYHFTLKASIALLALSFIWLAADNRQLQNQPLPLKPIKQLLGTIIFLFTLPWLNQRLSNYRDTYLYSKRISWIFIYEIFAIFLLAAWGHESHFNNVNAFMITLKMLMLVGILYIAIVVGKYSLTYIKLIKIDPNSSLLHWSRLYGGILFLLGCLTAFFMFWPRHGQTLFTPSLGSHTIGDMALSQRNSIGWQQTLGDLRIPHFFGIHSLQYFFLLHVLMINFALTLKSKIQFLHLAFIINILLWLCLQALALQGASPFNPQLFLSQLTYVLLAIFIYLPLHFALIRIFHAKK